MEQSTSFDINSISLDALQPKTLQWGRRVMVTSLNVVLANQVCALYDPHKVD